MKAFNPPTRWPQMPVAALEFPKSLDGTAPSHAAKARTGNTNGIQKKRNKGGLRAACFHGANGHGRCGCTK
jgi:hypothetical protein